MARFASVIATIRVQLYPLIRSQHDTVLQRCGVITFVTQKGGSGKTTLALSCAVAAEEHGLRTLILDMDPQRSAEAWYQVREAATPKMAAVTAAQIPDAIARVRPHFDVVLIDTAGRDEPSASVAIRHADLCLIPCRPTPADMKATPSTVATITRIGKLSAFVLNQTPPRGYRIREGGQGFECAGAGGSQTHRLSQRLSGRPRRRPGRDRVRTQWESGGRDPGTVAKDHQETGEIDRCPRSAYPLMQCCRRFPRRRSLNPRDRNALRRRGRRRSVRRPGIKQQTAYLPLPVYEQLRHLAFDEKVKMHALLMEGLDRVFADRGLLSIAELKNRESSKV